MGGEVGHITWVHDYPNLAVFRTFSKLAGLAGLRVGYGAFPEWLLPQLWKIKQPYNVNVAATLAASPAQSTVASRAVARSAAPTSRSSSQSTPVRAYRPKGTPIAWGPMVAVGLPPPVGQTKLRSLLIEAAWIWRGRDRYAQELYNRFFSRMGIAQKAIAAVARTHSRGLRTHPRSCRLPAVGVA